jgi:hypothetical protein
MTMIMVGSSTASRWMLMEHVTTAIRMWRTR